MRRHASLDELADLDAGILDGRKAGRVGQHVAACTECTQLTSQLSAVPQLLSNVQYPAMPDVLASQITVALAAESTARIAAQPATEGGRRDLPARPARARGHGSRHRWQLLGLSVRASRLVAAAGALIVLAGGGYVIASGLGNVGAGSGNSPSAASGSAGGLEVGQAVGPRVNYGPRSAERSIQTVTSRENFVRSKLPVQAVAAVRAARHQGVRNGPAAHFSALPDNASAPAANLGTSAGLSSSQLGGCVGLVAAGRTVVLVELAKFDGVPATIIVATVEGSSSAYVWAVGDACSATNKDVLDQEKIAHI